MLTRPQQTNELTPREAQQMVHEREMAELYGNQEIAKEQLKLDMMKLEAKWSSWLKIPLTIILLPFKLLLIIPLSLSILSKKDTPEKLWDLLEK